MPETRADSIHAPPEAPATELLLRFARTGHDAGYPTADLEERVLALGAFITAMSIAYGTMIASVLLPRRFAALQPAGSKAPTARESRS